MKQPRDFACPARDDIELVDVLQAMGDPVRLQLLRILERRLTRDAGEPKHASRYRQRRRRGQAGRETACAFHGHLPR